MYEQSSHIEEAPLDRLFGHRREYRYRVLGRDGESVIHHTNSLDDAEQYFQKCKAQWLTDMPTND